MVITVQIHYEDVEPATREQREHYAKAVAENVAEHFYAGDMPLWSRARRVVAWEGDPIVNTSHIKTAEEATTSA